MPSADPDFSLCVLLGFSHGLSDNSNKDLEGCGYNNNNSEQVKGGQ